MRSETLLACLPAVLLLLFTVWSGTFFGAAEGMSAAIGHLALLGCLFTVCWRGAAWPVLGARGQVLWLVCWLAIAVSWWLSPVSRAGTVTILLLPAFACLPGAISSWWRTVEPCRLALPAVSAVVAGVSAWALIAAWRSGGPVAMPLGHHNLLATWLVILLPIALTPWRDGGWRRGLAVLAGALGSVALLGTRSLAAAAALVVVVGMWAVTSIFRRRFGHRAGWLWLAIAGVLVVPQLPRLARLAEFDASLVARLGYLEAGWRGLWQRPFFGWGPGSTQWTVGEHFRPRPGIHPADEIVGDLHCLPLQIAYEIGLVGLVLVIAVALWWIRRHWYATPKDPFVRRAAGLGLSAGVVTSFAGLPLSVTALPVAALVVLGIGTGREMAPSPAGLDVPRGEGRGGGLRRASVLLPILLTVLLLPLDWAHIAYDQAVASADRQEQIRHLSRAVRLDPAFPLYRARLAWLESRTETSGAEVADRAHQAAVDAYGVASLWLVAGDLGLDVDAPWSQRALIEACRFSPLGALAPFHLATRAPVGPLGPEWGARAFLSEPRLLAARAWETRPELRDAAIRWTVDIRGVAEGWRHRLEENRQRGFDSRGDSGTLVLTMDADDGTSQSLHTFRRRPWREEIGHVELDLEMAAALDLVSAAGQPTTSDEVFAFREHCGLADPH